MGEQAFPIIAVRNLTAARDFYGRLGFTQTYQYPPQGEAGFVDDVDAVFEDARASGAPIVGEPKDEPWGERVAHLRDPDGNLVHLGAIIS